MRTTIKDIAKVAKVSDTAVSLAFKEKSRIGKKTREKILRIASQLGYIPNTSAQKLRNGKTKIIAFVINDITNPFYSLMAKEAEGIIEASGYEMFSADSNWDPAREEQIIQKMIQMRVEGVIFCLSEGNMNGIDLLKKYSIPCISVDSYSEAYKGSYIANNFEKCGKIVSQHLLDIGCKTPGIVGADETMSEFSAFKRIFNAFEKNFENNGIRIKAQNKIHGGLKIAYGRKAFERALKNGFNADGIICANDLCAMGVMEAAEKHGIKVGENLAVIGIDNLEVSEFPKISLTSVKQPYKEIAQKAATALFDLINKKGSKIQIELNPELIIRRSSSTFKIDNKDFQ
jgi:LacI family transcriptional regulator, galactose operon repressor